MDYVWIITYFRDGEIRTKKINSSLSNLYYDIGNEIIHDYEILFIEKESKSDDDN